MGNSSKEAVKARMVEALDGRKLTWLSEQTGDDYKNVQRWVSGDTAPPVDFVGRFAVAVEVDGHWLLTGDGPMRRVDPSKRDAVLDALRATLNELDES